MVLTKTTRERLKKFFFHETRYQESAKIWVDVVVSSPAMSLGSVKNEICLIDIFEHNFQKEQTGRILRFTSQRLMKAMSGTIAIITVPMTIPINHVL